MSPTYLTRLSVQRGNAYLSAMVVAAVLSLLGAFYIFAGVVAMRAGLTERLLDQAISQISMKPVERGDVLRLRWLLAISGLTFLSGLLLLAQLAVALWAFAASALAQAVYLFYVAPKVIDKDDGPDPRGRRQSINALVIYLAAMAFVAWAVAVGRLMPLSEVAWPVLTLVAIVAAGFVGYAIHLGRLPQRQA